MADKKKKSKHKDEKQKSKKQKATEMVAAVVVEAEPFPAGALGNAAAATALSSTKNATDDAILDGALACVEEFGIAGLTTRRIASLAGVNEVTIFRRFGNKEGLLQAVLAREGQAMQTATLGYTGDLAADLNRIVSAFSEATERRKGALALLLNAAHARGAEHLKTFHSFPAFDAVAQILARYIKEGDLRPEPPERALAALIGPIVFGTLVRLVVQGDVPPLDVSAYVQRYLRGRSTDSAY